MRENIFPISKCHHTHTQIFNKQEIEKLDSFEFNRGQIYDLLEII